MRSKDWLSCSKLRPNRTSTTYFSVCSCVCQVTHLTSCVHFSSYSWSLPSEGRRGASGAFSDKGGESCGLRICYRDCTWSNLESCESYSRLERDSRCSHFSLRIGAHGWTELRCTFGGCSRRCYWICWAPFGHLESWIAIKSTINSLLCFQWLICDLPNSAVSASS